MGDTEIRNIQLKMPVEVKGDFRLTEYTGKDTIVSGVLKMTETVLCCREDTMPNKISTEVKKNWNEAFNEILKTDPDFKKNAYNAGLTKDTKAPGTNTIVSACMLYVMSEKNVKNAQQRLAQQAGQAKQA